MINTSLLKDNKLSKLSFISPSNICLFNNDPIDWLLSTYFNVLLTFQFNPYFWRGIVLESALLKVLKCPSISKESLSKLTLSKYKDLKDKTDPNLFIHFYNFNNTYNEQRHFIESSSLLIHDAALSLSEHGSMEGFQKWVKWLSYKSDITPRGIIDFLFSKAVVEMKTKRDINQISIDHVMQVEIYSNIVNLPPVLFYLGSDSYKVISLNNFPKLRSEARSTIDSVISSISTINSLPNIDAIVDYFKANYKLDPEKYRWYDSSRKAMLDSINFSDL